MRYLVVLVLTVSALIVPAAPARASFITTWTSANPAEVLDVSYNGHTYYDVYVGKYNWSRIGGDSISFAGSNGTNYWSFCTELTQDITIPATYSIVAVEQAPEPAIPGGMGSLKADKLRQYFALNYSDNFDNLHAAAFQLGIWEIVFGNMTINDSATMLQANNYLKGIDGDLSHLNSSQQQIANELVALSSPGSQDQLTLQNPAPPGLVLAGIGCVSLFGLNRFGRKAT
jgi:hypothetical protein